MSTLANTLNTSIQILSWSPNKHSNHNFVSKESCWWVVCRKLFQEISSLDFGHSFLDFTNDPRWNNLAPKCKWRGVYSSCILWRCSNYFHPSTKDQMQRILCCLGSATNTLYNHQKLFLNYSLSLFSNIY